MNASTSRRAMVQALISAIGPTDDISRFCALLVDYRPLSDEPADLRFFAYRLRQLAEEIACEAEQAADYDEEPHPDDYDDDIQEDRT